MSRLDEVQQSVGGQTDAIEALTRGGGPSAALKELVWKRSERLSDVLQATHAELAKVMAVSSDCLQSPTYRLSFSEPLGTITLLSIRALPTRSLITSQLIFLSSIWGYQFGGQGRMETKCEAAPDIANPARLLISWMLSPWRPYLLHLYDRAPPLIYASGFVKHGPLIAVLGKCTKQGPKAKVLRPKLPLQLAGLNQRRDRLQPRSPGRGRCCSIHAGGAASTWLYALSNAPCVVVSPWLISLRPDSVRRPT
jgi:hypothetical protein